jgi:hypothetical protein
MPGLSGDSAPQPEAVADVLGNSQFDPLVNGNTTRDIETGIRPLMELTDFEHRNVMHSAAKPRVPLRVNGPDSVNMRLHPTEARHMANEGNILEVGYGPPFPCVVI